jgi:hypothetical protein
MTTVISQKAIPSCPEDAGHRFFRNVDMYSPNYMLSHPKRPCPSTVKMEIVFSSKIVVPL